MTEISATWARRLKDVYLSRVRGPVFEEMVRAWMRRFASDETLPIRHSIGPSSVSIAGKEMEIDVLVANDSEVPADRRIFAIGEAKSGGTLTSAHLADLGRKRAAFGERAFGAKLFLFGPRASSQLVDEAHRRPDVEIVDLDRLYYGS